MTKIIGWGIIVLNIIYLYAEVSFNFSLLDLVANDKIHTQDNLEFIGRSLSAAGASLIVLRAILLSSAKPAMKKAVLVILLCPLGFYATYNAQEQLLEVITAASPNNVKETVYDGYISQRSIANGSKPFTNIDYKMARDEGNARRAFLGTLSIHVLGNKDFHDKDINAKYIYPAFNNDFKSNTEFYYSKYLLLSNQIESFLDMYSKASRKAKVVAEEQLDLAWAKAARGMSVFPKRVQERNRVKLVNAIKAKVFDATGARLPRNWKHTDKRTFYRVVSPKITGRVNNDFEKKMRGKFGFSVPPHLTRSRLLKNKIIRAKLINETGIFGTTKGFTVGLSKSEFILTYKNVLPKNLAADYKNGRGDQKTVDKIFKLTVIPMLAVSFSLLFTVINGFNVISDIFLKLGFYGVRSRPFYILQMLFLMFLIIAPYKYMHGLAYQPFYHTLKSQLTDAPLFVSYYYEWLISVELLLMNLFEPIHYAFF